VKGLYASRFRRALVVGCGRSGIAAAELLVAAGCEVTLYDRRAEVADLPRRLAGCAREFGLDMARDEVFERIDLLVLSPGVPPAPWLERRRMLVPEAELHGELSLALAAVEQDWAPRDDFATVLITGTNGKSTVTALIGAMLAEDGRTPFVGGNLGTPLCELVLAVQEGRTPQPGALVIECSSYQLESTRAAPEAPVTTVSMILNVTPDHLDRYASIEEYAATKTRIFDGLAAHSLALLSARDPFTPGLLERVPAVCRCYLVGGDAHPRITDDGALSLHEHESYARELVPLAGRHNAINALFALAAARHVGVSREVCERALARFEALPHRMNPVADRKGVRWYDDSKATNVASVLAGLDGFERPFVLICGGRAKQGDDIGALREVLSRQGRGVVAIGESAEAFLQMAEGIVPCARASNMHEAVQLADEMAQPGDAVLLSPACASWDMFRNFAHRGEVFASAVRALS
jgi:UDP-N-acetylmuramoylalanine--D-glutamate ligase